MAANSESASQRPAEMIKARSWPESEQEHAGADTLHRASHNDTLGAASTAALARGIRMAQAYRPLEEIQLVQQEAFRYRSGGLVRRPGQRQDFVRPAGRQQRGGQP